MDTLWRDVPWFVLWPCIGLICWAWFALVNWLLDTQDRQMDRAQQDFERAREVYEMRSFKTPAAKGFARKDSDHAA